MKRVILHPNRPDGTALPRLHIANCVFDGQLSIDTAGDSVPPTSILLFVMTNEEVRSSAVISLRELVLRSPGRSGRVRVGPCRDCGLIVPYPPRGRKPRHDTGECTARRVLET